MSRDFLPVRALSEADDVFGFCSGNPDNDSWLRNRAAHAMGAKTACVHVVPNKNGDLCGFYVHFGFRPLGAGARLFLPLP